MTTMNVSLPDVLKTFVDEQVAKRGYDSSSKYVRELNRADRDRQTLRNVLLDGAATPSSCQLQSLTCGHSTFNGCLRP